MLGLEHVLEQWHLSLTEIVDSFDLPTVIEKLRVIAELQTLLLSNNFMQHYVVTFILTALLCIKYFVCHNERHGIC